MQGVSQGCLEGRGGFAITKCKSPCLFQDDPLGAVLAADVGGQGPGRRILRGGNTELYSESIGSAQAQLLPSRG